MAISINPVLPVLAAQEAGGVAPELVLQPGSVVNAQVLKVLSADLVRIAIAGLSIDVATEVPLQQGQNLQLAVTQTKDGIRLAMVGQGGDAAGHRRDAVTLSPDALADAAINRPAILSPKSVLTPLERAAVSAAAQAAATEQDSLAPLFANLGAAVSASNLPPKLQAAIAQVLAQQTSLDQNLDGGDIKTAFQKSGIFLEASLAAGSVPASGVPDLKAALIVLRQTLQSALGANRRSRLRPRRQAHRKLPRRRPAPRAWRRPVAQSRCAGNPAAAGAAAGRRKPRAGSARPPAVRWRPRSTPDLRPARRLNLLQEALQELGNPRARRHRIERRSWRGRDRSHQHAAAAVPRRASHRPADRLADDRAGCAARDHRASSARRYRCRHRTADPAAGGVAAGPHRQFGAEGRHERAALEFRNSLRDAAGHGDGAVRDFPRWRRAGSRGRQAGVAGAIFARRRAGRSGSRADLADRRQDLGADLGGTVCDGRSSCAPARPS